MPFKPGGDPKLIRRFTPDQIRNMIEMFLDQVPRKRISQKFLISKSHLHKILARQLYKDVKL